MKLLDSILFFIGIPKTVNGPVCCLCKGFGPVVDLGDGDYVHNHCFKEYLPTYKQHED